MRHPVNSTLVSDAASSTAPARSHRSKRTSRQRNPLRWRPARSALIQTLSRSSTCAKARAHLDVAAGLHAFPLCVGLETGWRRVEIAGNVGRFGCPLPRPR